MIKAKRLIFIFTVMSLFLMIIISRLLWLSFKDSNTSKSSVIPSNYILRGNIYDKNGSLLATHQAVSSIFSNPYEFEEKGLKSKITSLSRILNISKQNLIKKMNLNKTFNWLKLKVDANTVKKIKKLNMKGIHLQKDYKRRYPYNKVLAQTLGFVGRDNIGLEGIEYTYNSYLNGEQPLDSSLSNDNTPFGNHLYLTIDVQIQKIVEQILAKSIKQYQAKSGSVVMMDTSNGEILSLANYPSYNNNHFERYKKKQYRNLVITDSDEPGSVFKIFVSSLFLEEKIVDSSTSIYCKGSIQLYKKTIHCTKAHGIMTLHNIIKQSCNVGMILLSNKISKHKLYKKLRLFGFGKKTNITLSGESTGLLRSSKDWSGISKNMLSFGYEIATTPLQIAYAGSSLVNGGILYQPQIIKKITDYAHHQTKKYKPIIKHRTLSSSISNKMLQLLKAPIEKGGTGQLARIQNRIVLGKTGTINIFDKTNFKYNKNKVNTSFLGFISKSGMENEFICIFVLLREPKIKRISSQVAVPTFRKIAVKLLSKGLI